MESKSIIAATLKASFFLLVFFSLNYFASAASSNASFTVNLTIGNIAPTISWVQTGISANPVESSTTTIYVAFNVSDGNGFADINYTSAKVVLNQTGETVRSSSAGTCTAPSNNSLIMTINCSVGLLYYDRDGVYTINVSVKDGSSSYVDNLSFTLSYGQLQAMKTNKDGITFGSVNLGQSLESTNDPLVLNNTGNQNFTQVNITAYSLVGTSTSSQIINASAIYVNSSQNNFGDRMINNTPVALTNGSLSRDIGGVDFNRNLYFWISVPSSGLSAQTYNASNLWMVNVYP